VLYRRAERHKAQSVAGGKRVVRDLGPDLCGRSQRHEKGLLVPWFIGSLDHWTIGAQDHGTLRPHIIELVRSAGVELC
jgi:hypothetical protein